MLDFSTEICRDRCGKSLTPVRSRLMLLIRRLMETAHQYFDDEFGRVNRDSTLERQWPPIVMLPPVADVPPQVAPSLRTISRDPDLDGRDGFKDRSAHNSKS